MVKGLTADAPPVPKDLVVTKTESHRNSRSTRLRRQLAFKNIGAIYVLIAIIVMFSFWAPATFPKWATVTQVLNGNGVAALAALALVIPLSTGVFDISGAYTMSLTGVVAAYLLANGWSVWLSVGVALLVGIVIGIVNGTVVVTGKIDSFVGTLATGSLITAAITMVTKDTNINSPALYGSFAKIAQFQVFGLTMPVIYAAGLALILQFVTEHTPAGRRMYAVGFNRDASKLAGIRTEQLRFIALIVSGTLAGFTGVVLASEYNTGSPTAGTPYLLTAFAAVFLGATQFRGGRFNAWGTIVAVLLLGVGVTGLGLVNAPEWAGEAFTGIVLIAALAVTGMQRRRGRTGEGAPDEK